MPRQRYQPETLGRLKAETGYWTEIEMRSRLNGEWSTVYATCWVSDSAGR